MVLCSSRENVSLKISLKNLPGFQYFTADRMSRVSPPISTGWTMPLKKLSDYRISDQGLNLSDHRISDSEKTSSCPPLCPDAAQAAAQAGAKAAKAVVEQKRPEQHGRPV